MELDIKQQYILFSALMKIFENQKNIIKFCTENKITVKKISRSMDYVPFWFAETYDGINKAKYCYTSEEIKNGLIYLRSHGINPGLKNLLKTFNISVTKGKRRIFNQFLLRCMNKLICVLYVLFIWSLLYPILANTNYELRLFNTLSNTLLISSDLNCVSNLTFMLFALLLKNI